MKHTNNIQRLVADIRQIRDLDSKGTIELAHRAAAGDPKAREQITNSFITWVFGVAIEFAYRRGWDPEDVVSIAFIGFVNGMNHYPKDKDVPPSVVYKRYIHNEWAQRIEELNPGWKSRLSSRLRGYGRDWTIEDLDDITRSYLEAAQACKTQMRLDDAYDDHGNPMSEFVSTEEDTLTMEEDDKKFIRSLLTVLKPRTREIFTKVYGLDGSFPMHYSTVAKLYGITSEGCRRALIDGAEKMCKFVKKNPDLYKRYKQIFD